NVQGGLTKKHRLWKRWSMMIDRCENPNAPKYKNYGGRGITVCERWHSLPLFLEDVESSFREGMTIDRIDVNGDYTPSNFRWASKTEQARNKRRNRMVETKWGRITVAEAAERSGMTMECLLYRIRTWPAHHWFTPLRPRRSLNETAC